MVTKQDIVVVSMMMLIAGMLLMMGSNGADVFFWIGLGLVFTSLFGWITAVMWKIAGGVEKAVSKHLDD